MLIVFVGFLFTGMLLLSVRNSLFIFGRACKCTCLNGFPELVKTQPTTRLTIIPKEKGHSGYKDGSGQSSTHISTIRKKDMKGLVK